MLKRKTMKRAVCANALTGFIGVFMSAILISAVAASETTTGQTPIVVETAKSATLPEVMSRLKGERVVYVGETHTAYADHLLQLDVLKAMAADSAPLAVGVEWFQARFQPVLDDYSAGRIDEAELLRRTEYYDRWRFDYRLYRPILQFAKDNGIPLVALNASRELTNEIRRVGIDGLSQEFKQDLPDGYDFADKAYADRLREMFKQHPAGDAQFDRFLEVQLTWDEMMAQRAADYLKANPDARMLVLAGKGHIGGRSGIPNRVARRTGIDGTVIGSFNPATAMFGEADFLVLINDQPLPPPGLMQIMLDERDEGVFVKDFSDGSPAEKAGVEKKDRIVKINDIPIDHYADVKIAMIDELPGNEVSVTVERDSLFRGKKTLSLSFKLGGEVMMSPH